jgi:hypothetical protein
MLLHTLDISSPPHLHRVPRGIEKRVRDWVRFQYTEAQQEKKVSFIPCVSAKHLLLVFHFQTAVSAACYQKRRVLSDDALPEEFKLALAESLQHGVFSSVCTQFK